MYEAIGCRVVGEPGHGCLLIAVSSIGDTGPGTLRAAIEQANLDAAQDTITFAPLVTGTITIASALPDLSTNIVITGPGPSALERRCRGRGRRDARVQHLHRDRRGGRRDHLGIDDYRR